MIASMGALFEGGLTKHAKQGGGGGSTFCAAVMNSSFLPHLPVKSRKSRGFSNVPWRKRAWYQDQVPRGSFKVIFSLAGCFLLFRLFLFWALI